MTNSIKKNIKQKNSLKKHRNNRKKSFKKSNKNKLMKKSRKILKGGWPHVTMDIPNTKYDLKKFWYKESKFKNTENEKEIFKLDIYYDSKDGNIKKFPGISINKEFINKEDALVKAKEALIEAEKAEKAEKADKAEKALVDAKEALAEAKENVLLLPNELEDHLKHFDISINDLFVLGGIEYRIAILIFVLMLNHSKIGRHKERFNDCQNYENFKYLYSRGGKKGLSLKIQSSRDRKNKYSNNVQYFINQLTKFIKFVRSENKCENGIGNLKILDISDILNKPINEISIYIPFSKIKKLNDQLEGDQLNDQLDMSITFKDLNSLIDKRKSLIYKKKENAKKLELLKKEAEAAQARAQEEAQERLDAELAIQQAAREADFEELTSKMQKIEEELKEIKEELNKIKEIIIGHVNKYEPEPEPEPEAEPAPKHEPEPGTT